MITAFQSNAFQNNAFQIAVAAAAATSGPTRKQHIRYRKNVTHVLVPERPTVFAMGSFQLSGASTTELASHQTRMLAGILAFEPTTAPARSTKGLATLLGEPLRRSTSVPRMKAAARGVGRLRGQAAVSTAGSYLPVAVQNPTEAELVLAMQLIKERRRRRRR